MIRRYPALPSWPVEAQTVCMSIAWAAGTAAAFPDVRSDGARRLAHSGGRVRTAGGQPGRQPQRGLIPRNRRNRALLESLAARLGQTSTRLWTPCQTPPRRW